jgi:hypothetical protein
VEWHVVQVNVGRFLAPPDDPLIADFMAGLDPVNAVADAAPGFVWRLQGEDGNATSIRPDADDALVAINLSVWTSVEALAEFVYRATDHLAFLRRRREWFSKMASHHQALWWVPAGTIPTVAEAMDRIARLDAHGPTPEAFTFRQRYGPPGASATDAPAADARDVCEV